VVEVSNDVSQIPPQPERKIMKQQMMLNCRFITSVMMTPVKRRKRHKFAYRIYASNISCHHYTISDDVDDIVMVTGNFCMRKYDKCIFAVF